MFAKVFIFLGVIAAATAATWNAQPVPGDHCLQVCPLLYMPVCGTDGENFLEFSNPCEMRVRNCLIERTVTKTMVATELDRCRTELVNNMDSLLVKLGNFNLEKPECLIPCPRIYKPVCISNGKYRMLINNECLMAGLNCALGNKDTFKVLRNNTC